LNTVSWYSFTRKLVCSYKGILSATDRIIELRGEKQNESFEIYEEVIRDDEKERDAYSIS